QAAGRAGRRRLARAAAPGPRAGSPEPVPLSPVHWIERVADHGLVALVDDRRLLRDPDDDAGMALDVRALDAEAEAALQHGDHLVVEHGPLDRAAVEAGEADTHGPADLRPDQAGDGGRAGRPAEAVEGHLAALEKQGLG